VFLGLDKGLGRTTGHAPFTVSRWRSATLDAWPALIADGVPDVVHGHAEAEVGLLAAGLIGRGRILPALSTLYGSTLSGILDHLRLAGRPSARTAAGGVRGALGVLPTFGSARWLRLSRVVALSNRHARLVRLSYGLSQVTVVSPGVDTVLYHPPDPAVRRVLRARYLIPADAFTWAVVGRLAAGKGVDVAIAALARLVPPTDAPDHVLVAGTGPEESALRALAASMGVGERVTWASDVQPPAAAYMCADALLFPTGHEESFGLVALEAMACGLTVLARARGAVAEVLADTGWLVASGDPAAWASAMTGLRSDETARRYRAAAGRQHALRAHCRLGTVAALERLYGDAIAERELE
jgi:D-inositol-3-phosphate glycosyltransferase